MAVSCILLLVPIALHGVSPNGKSLLHEQRQAATDLEVGGALTGLPFGSTRYVAYKDLLALPQVTYACLLYTSRCV